MLVNYITLTQLDRVTRKSCAKGYERKRNQLYLRWAWLEDSFISFNSRNSTRLTG